MVAFNNRCSVKGLPAPVYAAYAPGYSIVVVSCKWKRVPYPCPPKGSFEEPEPPKRDNWEIVLKHLEKLNWIPGPLEWWHTDKSPARLPRLVPRPEFVVQAGESTFTALDKAGFIQYESRLHAQPWDVQPRRIRQLWRTVAADFFHFPVPVIPEDFSEFYFYLTQYMPLRWMPKLASKPCKNESNGPLCQPGFFFRILDLFVSCTRANHIVWARDTERRVRRLVRQLKRHVSFRTPWVTINEDQLYWNYLCETACELIWYEKYKSDTVIEFQVEVVFRLVDDAIQAAPINQWILALDISYTKTIPGPKYVLDFGVILQDICQFGVRRFLHPVVAKSFKHPLKQRPHKAYFCDLPYRQVDKKLIDPNYVELTCIPPFELQALRLDLPMLPLLPQKMRALVHCVHALHHCNKFMSVIPWCCKNVPVVVEDKKKFYLHTSLFGFDPNRVLSKL